MIKKTGHRLSICLLFQANPFDSIRSIIVSIHCLHNMSESTFSKKGFDVVVRIKTNSIRERMIRNSLHLISLALEVMCHFDRLNEKSRFAEIKNEISIEKSASEFDRSVLSFGGFFPLSSSVLQK